MLDEKPARDDVYKHYKRGTTYIVVCVGHHEDLGIDMISYRSLHDGKVWVRALSDFTKQVEPNVPRFRKISQ